MTSEKNENDFACGPSVLLVDDEDMCRARLLLALGDFEKELNVQFLEAESVETATTLMASRKIDVVLLDKNLVSPITGNVDDGIEAIPQILNLHPHVQILVVTGSQEIPDVVRAMELGAFGYVTKDTPDDLIKAQVGRAIRHAMLTLQQIRADRTSTGDDVVDLIGSSDAVRDLRNRIDAVAESRRPVLLLGDTGTGKTTVAKIIHEQRRRFLTQEDRPFFSLNMGAMPAQLVERELFGNEPGAFTDAKHASPGYVELAHNGTLFLDEIGDAPLDLQVKLLKVIEGGRYFRLGGTSERHSSFKLICATNRDLGAMVAQGTFRRDLFMRISTFTLTMPSLSDRREDIPAIVRSLLPRCCRENNVFITFEDLPADFIEYLTHAPIDGNIRGLDQQISQLLVFAPRDRRGRPVFTAWRRIPGLQIRHGARSTTKSGLTIHDLLSMPLDLFGDDFPGFETLIERFGDRILLDAKTRFGLGVRIAQQLKLHPSLVSRRLKRIETNGRDLPAKTAEKRGNDERDERSSATKN